MGTILHRRSLLAGVPAIACIPVATPSADRDAALIALCERHAENWRAYNTEGGRLEYDACPLWAAYAATLAAIDKARPHTLAGVVAKARVAELEDDATGQEWAMDIVRDLLRLHGGQA